jgi:hypothetical protein
MTLKGSAESGLFEALSVNGALRPAGCTAAGLCPLLLPPAWGLLLLLVMLLGVKTGSVARMA